MSPPHRILVVELLSLRQQGIEACTVGRFEFRKWAGHWKKDRLHLQSAFKRTASVVAASMRRNERRDAANDCHSDGTSQIFASGQSQFASGKRQSTERSARTARLKWSTRDYKPLRSDSCAPIGRGSSPAQERIAPRGPNGSTGIPLAVPRTPRCGSQHDVAKE